MNLVLSSSRLALVAVVFLSSAAAWAAVPHPGKPNSPRAPRSCDTPIGVIADGGVAIGFTSPTSSPGAPCETGSAICVDGVLNGPTVYPSCQTLSDDCAGVPNGGSVTGFETPTAPCVPSTVTCVQGVLSGPMPAMSCD